MKFEKRFLLNDLQDYLAELEFEFISGTTKVIKYSRPIYLANSIVEVNTSIEEGKKLILLKFYHDTYPSIVNKLYVSQIDEATKLNINKMIEDLEL